MEQVSEYYSLFTSVVYIPMLRSLGYNRNYYHASLLTEVTFKLVMYRYPLERYDHFSFS